MYPFVNRVSANINDREVYFRKLLKHLKIDVLSKNNCLKYIGMKDGKPVFKIGDNILLKNQIGSKSKMGIIYLGGFHDVEGKLFKYAIKIGKGQELKDETKILEKLRNELLNHNSPHFPFLYSVLECNSQKKEFSNISDNELKVFPQLLKSSSIPLTILLNELANGDLKTFIHANYSNSRLIQNALVQVMLSLFSLYAITGIQHRDSHWGNFLYHKIRPGGYIHYKIEGQDYYLENLGYLWVIWDFGLSKPLSSNASLMSDDIKRIIYAFMNKNQKGWLDNKFNYEPAFSNKVYDIINNYFVINKNALYNRLYNKDVMKEFVKSLFKDFAKLGWISTTSPIDKKLIINDKPYVINN